MDDFGDLIYIVFAILAAVVGAVQSSKKKKEMQRRREQYSENPAPEESERETYIESVFEKLERAMTGETENEPEAITEKEYEPEYEQSYHEPEYKQVYTEPAYKSPYEKEVAIDTNTAQDNPYYSLNEAYAKEQFYDKEKYSKKIFTRGENDTSFNDYNSDEDGNINVVELGEKSDFNLRELFNSTDDLKKAIILSEIIGRKF